MFIFFSLPMGIILEQLPFYIKRNLIYIIFDILIVYTLFRYIPKKKPFKFILIYFEILLINLLIKELFNRFIEPDLFSSDIEKINALNAQHSFLVVLVNDLYYATSHYFIVTLPAISIKLFKNWDFAQLNVKDLEKQSLEHKIHSLRNQLHPHFLFNTLNNLYSLAIDKSEKVPEVIIKISSILRYMLKEHNKKIVNLTEELEIIYTYIELEQLRYGDILSIEIKNEVKDIDISTIKGPPLVLFTFVENAFKHGPGKSFNKSWIKINIKFELGIFHFIVENSKEEDNFISKKENNTGLGLLNIKSTLYLFFQDQFHLDISDNLDSYKSILKINYNNENKMFNSRRRAFIH